MVGMVGVSPVPVRAAKKELKCVKCHVGRLLRSWLPVIKSCATTFSTILLFAASRYATITSHMS